jgi:hypothetical protein
VRGSVVGEAVVLFPSSSSIRFQEKGKKKGRRTTSSATMIKSCSSARFPIARSSSSEKTLPIGFCARVGEGQKARKEEGRREEGELGGC